MKLRYFFFLMLFLIPVSVKADHIYNLNMDIYVDENGNADVTETWDVKADSGTEWYKQYKNMQRTEVSDFNVLMDGLHLNNKPYWNIDGTLEEKKGYYGIHMISDGFELCFGKGDMERHVFTLKYKLSNFVYNTSDSQIVYFTLFPNVKADNFIVNVTSFYKFPKSLDVWGYGYKGYAYVKSGKIIMANKGKLRNDYVVLLAKFPPNTFQTENSSLSFSDFDTVLKMAKEGSYEYDYSDNNESISFSWYIFIFIIFAIVLPFVFVYILEFSFAMFISSIKRFFSKRRKHSYYKDNKKVKYDDVPFFREIPCNKDIYYSNTLIYLNGMGYDNGNIVGAIILKWASEGKIKFIKNNSDTFTEKNGSIQFFDNISFVNELEESLYKIMKTASDDNLLEAKELKKYCKKHYISFTSLLDKFNNDKLKDLVKAGYISAPKYDRDNNDIYRMSEKTYEDSVQLLGLKKFLVEFSKVDTKEVMDVKLWDEYLMFAYLFGIADKVAKQLHNLYPKEMSDLKFDYNVALYISDITNDSFHAMSTHKTMATAAAKAHESAASSYSGGGGGFSSGGGGGGSIGGGGSMGGR